MYQNSPFHRQGKQTMRLILKEYRTTVDHSQNGVKVISHKFFDNKGEFLNVFKDSDANVSCDNDLLPQLRKAFAQLNAVVTEADDV
jgi:hypothetical protein